MQGTESQSSSRGNSNEAQIDPTEQQPSDGSGSNQNVILYNGGATRDQSSDSGADMSSVTSYVVATDSLQGRSLSDRQSTENYSRSIGLPSAPDLFPTSMFGS